MSGRSDLPVLAVTSPGLWAIRHDLETILGATIRPWPLSFRPAGLVGWGNRPSGLRARWLAKRAGLPCILIEDGFLKSHAPGRADPAHSYVIDRKGIYFDMRGTSALSDLIDMPLDDEAKLARASAIRDLIRANRLSKYNNSPMLRLDEAGLDPARPFVLLVDQVAGDASIAGALASEAQFGAMLADARSRYPHAALVVRTHPAAGDNSLLKRAAARLGLAITVAVRMNPWPLLEAADAVYTVSSQLGFEALMAGRNVHCFGATYYSHRGLTFDHVDGVMPKKPASLETIIHRAYVDYPVYLDLHDRSVIEVEQAIGQMLSVRDHRNRVAVKIHTGGLSPWKRKAITPFVTGMMGPPVHCRTLSDAIGRARAEGGGVALWGSSQALPEGVPAIRLEDGFIRSRGLGVMLSYPCSLAIDGEHPYYDARGPSRLEMILSDTDFDAALLARARRLIDRIVRSGVSKYNVGETPALPEVEPGRLRILVPGQVEKDASIRYGSPVIATNAALVAAVRAIFADAFIAYKEHPDVTSGMRSGGPVPDQADLIIRSGNINDWIGWADRIETMTSLTGFEALIRQKPVGVHGMPFYAGWGLTDDRMAIARRGRPLSVEALAAAALILYPSYIHPASRLPCSAEDLVEAIAQAPRAAPGPVGQLAARLAQIVNRIAVRHRDGKL